MLYLIGLGLNDEKDVSLKGIEAAKKAGKIFAELYTSSWRGKIEELEKIIGKKIELLDRKQVEEKDMVLETVKIRDVAFFVPGDPLVATTHADLVLRARKAGMKVEIVHSSSIFSAVAETGLHIYKFGPIISLPAPQKDFSPTSPYEKIAANLKAGLHTLILLDIGMSASDALKLLLENGAVRPDTKIIIVARLGATDSKIRYGEAAALQKENLGPLPHALILPAELHFTEKEFLEVLK